MFSPFTASASAVYFVGAVMLPNMAWMWNDDRTSWPDPIVAVFDRIATSGKTFPEFQRINIRKTLDALKRATEVTTTGP